MKKCLYLIGGTMGIGKTTISQQLKLKLTNSVFLDGDWCWDASPFQVNDQTKKMVMENICFLLNQFIHCESYENIIFCWVMHEQSIIDEILANLDTQCCKVKVISLICDGKTLASRIEKDIENGLRQKDVLARSLNRLDAYNQLATNKIDTTNKTIDEIVEEVMNLD